MCEPVPALPFDPFQKPYLMVADKVLALLLGRGKGREVVGRGNRIGDKVSQAEHRLAVTPVYPVFLHMLKGRVRTARNAGDFSLVVRGFPG